jgi:hypothetical protein
MATGTIGFLFEERVGQALALLEKRLGDDWIFSVYTEQEIRDFFDEQSLNGVDHMIQVEDPLGRQTVFLLQEKWKFMTNQREVSQFLDCCARIVARMPDFKGKVERIWVTRTVPTVNGEKSLDEGQVLVVQSCTSQTMLAYMTTILVAEMIGAREKCSNLLEEMGPLLPETETQVAVAVSQFGEKNVGGAKNKKHVITVRKVE